MINIENELFTIIADNLENKYQDIFVTSDIVNAPEKFPTVSILETNNKTSENTVDSSKDEKYSIVTYDINIYSNEKNAKSKCREIADTIDEQLIGLGFTRIFLQPIPNFDNSIYRFTSRYSATVSKHKTIYK